MEFQAVKRFASSAIIGVGGLLWLAAILFMAQTAQNSSQFSRLHPWILMVNVAGLAVLVGLLGNAPFGLWWLDPIAALVVAGIAVKQGLESWRGEGCCTVCACGVPIFVSHLESVVPSGCSRGRVHQVGTFNL